MGEKSVIQAGAEILLPREGVDVEKWAVIACDQFTSDSEYWEGVRAAAGDAESAFSLVLPEIWLSSDNSKEVAAINKKMDEYIAAGVFRTAPSDMILVYRHTAYGNLRTGIVAAFDLERYSYRPGDRAAIRATEATIEERIPPRVRIRAGAALELPHVMILCDDPENTVFRAAEDEKGARLYASPLMMNGGHIEGYALKDSGRVRAAVSELLAAPNAFLAVGDGNHSLASAKAHWENVKSTLPEGERENHPARFALAELTNLYDEGLKFEPIHRAVFGAGARFLPDFKAFMSGEKGECLMYSGNEVLPVPMPAAPVEAVRKTDEFLRNWLSAHSGAAVDYIHGEDSLARLAREKGAAGIVMPKLEKADFFKAVKEYGVLPKKTFSMGEAEEKRYYLESRKITV